MDKVIAAAIRHFQEIYDGDNWVSINFVSAVKDVTPALAFRQPPGQRNSIAAIVKHMTDWKNFLLQRLKGDDNFDIEQDDSFNIAWYAEQPDRGWQQLLNEQAHVQALLCEELKKTSSGILAEPVSGRPYNMDYLLNGVQQHDMYHIGQIELLRKQLLALDF